MTLYDLWFVCPNSHLFINNVDGVPVEYTGAGKYSYWYVVDVRAVRYPNYGCVLSVTIRKV